MAKASNHIGVTLQEEDEFVDALEGSDTASATTNKASRHAQEILTANRRVTDLENKIKLAACKKLDSEYTLRSKLNTVSAQGMIAQAVA